MWILVKLLVELFIIKNSITSSKCGFKEEVRKGWVSQLRAGIAIQYNWLYFLFFSQLCFLAAHAHLQCWWLEYSSYFSLKPFGLYFIPTELLFRSFLPHYVPSTVLFCACRIHQVLSYKIFAAFTLMSCTHVMDHISHQHSCPVFSQLCVYIKHWHSY